MKRKALSAMIFLALAAALFVTIGCTINSGRKNNTIPDSCLEDAADIVFDHEYDVGPGQAYARPSDVPWENLGPGTLVRIHYRDVPYADKWVINIQATEDKPLVVRGVMQDGSRPVITGENAVTRSQLDYWNEERSVIKIGGSNIPANEMQSHIIIENLDIRSGRPPFMFTGRNGLTNYSDNAASIHVEYGDHITIRNCVIHDSGNGIFTSSSSSNILITGNYIYDNGIEGSIYQHNSYTESLGIMFQFNRYGPLRAGCGGNNLKDRSSGTVIRYNWIESGNRQLDLVDAEDSTDLVNDASYHTTLVYGNILVEPEGAGNSQIVHYGGDSGDESIYRKGVLYFYHNTVVSTRTDNTTLFRASSNEETIDARNNIFYGANIAICDTTGRINLGNNWLPDNWALSFSGLDSGASINDTGNLEGEDPGFAGAGSQDFILAHGSECINAAGSLANGAPAPGCQYVKHQGSMQRPVYGVPDMGALESE